ncbi:hypothetical protein TNIN_282971 [Trichonephila inaurata madagascariensis]|uniref:Mos1 transposase HTH domain-containing protein n=1 Tax=Trichonephila inaurata madagascariensis TaxID=2747483 RepID=A0A8X6YE42_9ARAC|nr:hypothetical protein TNIN_282971 [Trichonephila inaurata madagascariensis]
MEQRDVGIVIQYEFHPETSIVTNVNNAWGAGTIRKRTVRRLFAKFRSGNMENDHKPGAGRSVRCDVDHFWQKIETPSTLAVRQLLFKLSASSQTISRHLETKGTEKKLEV